MCGATSLLESDSDLEKIIQGVLMQELKLAGEEEAKLAIDNGHIDKDGTPCITVIADGAWSKRSYKTNYNALSGVAVIIGEATKKVLFLDMSLRTKLCLIILALKNWSGSSTAMESAIIIEGFKNSMEIHGLKYTKLVGDGDSSVTKKLLIEKPYGATLVEKVECVNHLLRNLCHKLKDISKTARKKKLESSILKFRVAIKKAAEYRGKSVLTYPEKLSCFRKDVQNSIDHIFGSHEKCDEYFCTGVKAGEENLIPEIIECGLKQDIINCLQRVVTHSSSFLANKNNNAAELFNSLVNKYVGGKRVNFSFKASYQTRCQLAAIAYNCKEQYIEKIMEFVGLSPGLYTRRFIIKRQLRRERSVDQKKKRGFRTKITISHPDEDYGAVEEISDEEMKSRKEKLETILRKTPEEIIKVEQDTRGQSSNPLWHQERTFRITASNFGRICKLKTTTKPDVLVKNLLYNKFIGNSATKYGQEHELVAIQDFEELTGFTVTDCGLFIGHDNEYFLGASPDGLVADNNSIVEVKCPEVLKKHDP
ncbi:hypothetical protein NQ317_000094 [Molorchus minor]|uniref:YqaJ viral recombinase domain-containing protein n=1 Tax=Molorchus minor TaxID=1323400 RepID=A0ABQ9ISN6_9CUCU|nr:hypothetical protein NQ317_000094 [Molorchus minor]